MPHNAQVYSLPFCYSVTTENQRQKKGLNGEKTIEKQNENKNIHTGE